MALVALRRVAEPLSGRDFRLLWIGQAVSALGGVFQTVALAWLVLDLTGSAVALSGMLLVIALPSTALNLVGGVATDRYDPRTVMIWSDAIRASVVGLVAILAINRTLPLWALYGLLAVYGIANGIFGPASLAIVPALVPEERLQAANSLSRMTPQLATIIGAPVAGGLVALVGSEAALALNSVSFAVAALSAWAITPLTHRAVHGSRPPILDSARAGFSYVLGRPWLSRLLLVDAVLSFAAIGPLSSGLPLLVRERSGMGADDLGFLLAGFGVGSTGGILWLGSRDPGHRRGMTFCLLQLPQGAMLGGLAFAPPALAVLLLAGIGFLGGASEVIYLALIQSRIDKDMMGRVMSLVGLSAGGLVLLSQLASGITAQALGSATLFAGAGLLMTVGAVGGLLSQSIRNLD